MSEDRTRQTSSPGSDEHAGGTGVRPADRAAAPADDDPLAELIRMVKQDDPFAEVLAALNAQTEQIKSSVSAQQVSEAEGRKEQAAAEAPPEQPRAPVHQPQVVRPPEPPMPPEQPVTSAPPRAAAPEPRHAAPATAPGIEPAARREAPPIRPPMPPEPQLHAPEARAPELRVPEHRVTPEPGVRDGDIDGDRIEAPAPAAVVAASTAAELAGAYRAEDAYNTDEYAAYDEYDAYLDDPRVDPEGFGGAEQEWAPAADAPGQAADPATADAARLDFSPADPSPVDVPAADLPPAGEPVADPRFEPAQGEFDIAAEMPRPSFDPTGPGYEDDIEPDFAAPEPARAAEQPVPGYNDPAFAAYDRAHAGEVEADSDGEEPRRRGAFFLVGALLGLALLGSGFIYAYNETVSRDAQGEPPTLRADTRPVKVAPERPGGEQIENQNALVYDRVTGEPRQSTERLVSREEQVVDIPKGQPKDDSRPLAGSSANPPPLRPQPLTLASGQQAGASAPQAAGAEPAQGDGIAPLPKRVRTVLVRPDGSIAEAPPAAATAPGAPSASVPVPPQRPGNAPQPAASRAAPVAPAQAQPPVQRVTPGGSVGTIAVQPVRPVQPAAGNAPIRLTPQPAVPAHDNGQPQQLGQPQPLGQSQQLASAQPSAIAPQQPLVAPGQGGDFVVQLAARRSETQARATFDELRQRYSQLGRYRPLIQEADLGDRGVYYRVRVGPMSSQSEASQLCDSLKSSGLSDCLVRPR